MNRHDRRAAEAKSRPAEDPRLVGMEVRFGGRTLEVRVFVNTDEEDWVVAQRVREAARGPKQAMAVITVADVPVERAVPLWDAAMKASRESVEREIKA
jgi:hypothetical protein